MLEISQAFAGKAGAAVEPSDIGQRREIIAQQSSSSRLHVQCTVTEARGVGLEEEVRVTISKLIRCIQSFSADRILLSLLCFLLCLVHTEYKRPVQLDAGL